MSQLSNQSLGKLGEKIAANYLLKNGYKILERNFKARYGEIDIVARDRNILVFVEVKTRNDDQFGTPEEAVTRKKLREVIKTAQFYKLSHTNEPDELRIDVIAIQLTGSKTTYFKHIQNVTL